MIDILLNNQVVAVVIPQLVKVFCKSLLDMLPDGQIALSTKPHENKDEEKSESSKN